MRYVEELTEAIRSQLAMVVGVKDQIGFAVRQKLKEGYKVADLRGDLMSGLVVGVVALPLSMALAIASGVAPQHGLYTAIIAGIVCALLGGSRFQVTGPTAAFVVILVPIVKQYGLGGLLLAGMMAGVILVFMGLARLGKLMQFIPHPVTTGFTAGIAVVIAALQLKGALGVKPAPSEGTIDYFAKLWHVLPDTHRGDVIIAVTTIALLLILPKIIKRVPAPLLALTIAAVLAYVLRHLFGSHFDVATIGTQFSTKIGGETVHGIPPLPPLPHIPWHATDGGDTPQLTLSFHTIRMLLPSAFAIAMLGAIESLMSAVIADGMSGTKHDPNAELLALGIANIVCPIFGGIAATGALARTATNIRSGARSPFSSVIHALFVLACTIALAPLVGYLPIAAMSGLLIIVAKNMSEARHFLRMFRFAPRSDVMVLLTCFGLTVVFDMVIAVSVGVVLAALLFMRRMAMLTQVSLDTELNEKLEMPAGIRRYEIAGPMFFGAAKSAMETLAAVGDDTRVIIMSMRNVPVMDATGLVALESSLDRLNHAHKKVILCGVQPQVADLFARAGIKRIPGKLAFAPDLETAVSMAIVHDARMATPPAGTPTASPA